MRSFTAIAGWVADVPGGAVGPALPPARRTAVEDDAVAGRHRRRRRRGRRRDRLLAVAASQFACRPLRRKPRWRRPRWPGRHRRRPRPTTTTTTTTATDTTTTRRPVHRSLLAVAVDGKTVRGAVAADGAQVHLLPPRPPMADQLVLGQVEVGAKTNEIPMFAPLIDQLAATGIDPASW